MKRAPVQPTEVDIRIVDGVFVKATHFRHAGMLVPQHAHEFSHLSYVASGAVNVFADGEPLGEFTAPTSIVIPALVKHLFEILADNTVVLCIHNADHADPDGEPPIAAENSLELED
jgi:hypothetical protein